MRPVAQIQMGYYRTPDRIVTALANMLKVSNSHATAIIDPGCGEGMALELLRKQMDGCDIRLYGVESDQNRARLASERLVPSGGECLWANIEDVGVAGEFPLLWFNAPYDSVRNAGRLEVLLFHRVKNWAQRGGILVEIIPDYILTDASTGLAVAIERDYQVLNLHRFPDPEYQAFRQCVLIGKRRDRAKSNGSIAFPEWAKNPTAWPALPDEWVHARIEIPPSLQAPKLRRITLSADVTIDAVSRSPIRANLLREAMADALNVEPPLLPLREGHLALAIAGGLCDGIVEQDGIRFLMKGLLRAKILNTKNSERFNALGQKTADVQHWRTNYIMAVRCLRESGDIEEYTSAEGEELPIDSNAEIEGDIADAA